MENEFIYYTLFLSTRQKYVCMESAQKWYKQYIYFAEQAKLTLNIKQQ